MSLLNIPSEIVTLTVVSEADKLYTFYKAGGDATLINGTTTLGIQRLADGLIIVVVLVCL